MEESMNGNMPTERQFVVIRRLANKTKASVNLNNIKTKHEASKIIEDLISRQNGRNGNNGNYDDCRDKKVAYGLSVKLVFCKFKEQKLGWKSDNFWSEVESFYQQYIEHQNKAMQGLVVRRDKIDRTD